MADAVVKLKVESQEFDNKLARATSKWVLLEADTRKIKRIPDTLQEEYYSEPDRCVFEEEIGKLREPETEEISIMLQTRRTDLDINNHVNNLNYLIKNYKHPLLF